jgi:predicted nuclease of predicted toxin-antitoxin system
VKRGAALRVYLDEDVDVMLARLLVARGFDCQTASELGHLGWSDEQHLENAEAAERVIITHNRVDFELLARQWWTQSREHAGMVLAVRRAHTSALLHRILPVLSKYDQAGWHNVVMYA